MRTVRDREAVFHMTNSALKLVSPTSELRTVQTPRRKPNAELRSREYLTAAEIERLIKATGNNRHSHRDATMILIAYRHGLRACEVCTLRWDDADLTGGKLHVRRAKNGAPSVHPLAGVELRALRRLQREQEPKSPYVFTSERGAPFTRHGFGKLVARLGAAAGFEFGVHPHMLRHSTGFKLANDGVDTRSLQHHLGRDH